MKNLARKINSHEILSTTDDREQYLKKAYQVLIKPMFTAMGVKVPPFRVSCGFTGAGKNAIGVCYKAWTTEDNRAQIMIVPTIENSTRVLDIFIHELIHVVLPNDGHNHNFQRMAKRLGLVAPFTATTAGTWLQAKLDAFVDTHGQFPHKKLNLGMRYEMPKDAPKGSTPVPRPIIGAPKKQGTRQVKVFCVPCDYIMRTTQKNIDRGLPDCPCCGARFQVG